MYCYDLTKAINALFADINKGEDVTRDKTFSFRTNFKLYLLLFVVYRYGVTKAINALFADINKGEDLTRGKDFCVKHILSCFLLYCTSFTLCCVCVSQRCPFCGHHQATSLKRLLYKLILR